MLSGVLDIYRKVKAKALMIDQQIWPLLFLSFADTEGNVDRNMERMTQALSECYDALLMPHIWTMHDGYEKYADKLAMPLMPEDETNLTVMSTVFALSNLFSTKLSIPAKIFELGITEKTFAIIYLYQEANERVFLPSAINPTAVVVDRNISDGALDSYLERFEIGNKRVEIRNSVVKKESDQGNTLLLIRRDSGIKMVNLVTGEECVLDDLEGIDEGLRSGDASILAGNLLKFANAKGNNIFRTVCGNCVTTLRERNDWLFNGDTYPYEPGVCEICG